MATTSASAATMTTTIVLLVAVLSVSARYGGGTPEGDALRICSGAYFDAANDLDIDAHDSLDSRDYVAASRLVSGAGGAADTCEGAFAAAKVSSVMADVDQKMKDRCSVARDLINLLIPPPPPSDLSSLILTT
uniref:Pectinesterase inhibitor domain-containing protein n=1 Tax=Oryza brachyantha TaxID=4533 RepID=J3KVS3_ORYBR